MAETSRESADDVATRLIGMFLVVTAILTLFSIGIITMITHNIYAASYYSISALFDANNEGASTIIAAGLAGANPMAFYSIIAVSILDGIAKAVIIGFLIAAFINLLSNIDLRSKFGTITAKRLKDHVIICGYSMLAERLCDDLSKDKVHFVVVDSDPEKINTLRDLRFNVVEGDFTERKVLENASISRAKAIVFATENDFVNLLGVVTARHIEPKARIISRARVESTVRKMQRGGAELCLVPEVVAGVELGDKIAKV